MQTTEARAESEPTTSAGFAGLRPVALLSLWGLAACVTPPPPQVIVISSCPEPVAAASPPPVETATVAAIEETETSTDVDELDDPDDGLSGEEILDALPVATSTAPDGIRYTADVGDEELARRWANDRASLGSVCLGVPNAGRLINARPFPDGPTWTVVDPPNTFATEETIAGLVRAIEEVARAFPNAPPLRVNHISAKEGGYLPPHSSHQVGRDVDLGFYYEVDGDGARTRVMDVAANWALVRALVVQSDVERILVDRRVQHLLHTHALASGEDPTWLRQIFFGPDALVQHARRHRDHFHVRFYNPRAQELGRRVRPLLGTEESAPQMVRHRIRNGESLGHIALRYGVSIRGLMRANRMRTTFLRAGRSLAVPVRGSCVLCPAPPPVIVPQRRLPPEPALSGAAGSEARAAP